MRSVSMPFGPTDWALGKRKAFMDGYIERLNAHGWTIGVQLMTGSLDWDGILDCCTWVRANGGTIVWHAPDSWPLRLGYDDFDVAKFQEQLAPAKAMIESGQLDAINLHLGVGRWTEWAEENPGYKNNLSMRYQSWMSAEEILHQIQNHIDHLRPIVDWLGGNRVLLENTSSWCSLPDYHFLALQFGAGEGARYFANELGCGITLDEGHRKEDVEGLARLGPFSAKTFPVPAMQMEREEFEILRKIGMTVKRGLMPWQKINEGIEKINEIWSPRYYHVDGATQVFGNGELDGPIDAHQPVMLQNAEESGVYAMVRHANRVPEQSLGICVEACGRNYWEAAGYKSSGMIADDELAKQVTFDTIAKVVEIVANEQ